MRVFVTTLTVIIFISQNIASGQVSGLDTPFSSSTSYLGANVNNLSGGLRTGSTFSGLLIWKLKTNPSQSPFPANGVFQLSVANSHGGLPSSGFIGDFQGALNIEAGNYTFLYELWYRQNWSNYSLLLGLLDLNTEFANSRYTGLFQNSSFGIHSTLGKEMACPIYPVTALGITLSIPTGENSTLRAGLFDGHRDDFTDNEYNIHWNLNRAGGYMLITEFEHDFMPDQQFPLLIKFGAYLIKSRLNAMITDSPEKKYGFYSLIESDIWVNNSGEKKLSAFSQISYTPSSFSANTHYFSLGFHLSAPFESRPDDIAGIAAACAVLREPTKAAETTVEFAYQAALTGEIFIKPDIQYIIKPAGTDITLRNALAISIQFGFNF